MTPRVWIPLHPTHLSTEIRMNTATLATPVSRNRFLRRVLTVDAATCIATGALLAIAADPLAPMLGLSGTVLKYAAISLFPIAAFMLWVAARAPISVSGAWLVIIGNVGWVIGSAVV